VRYTRALTTIGLVASGSASPGLVEDAHGRLHDVRVCHCISQSVHLRNADLIAYETRDNEKHEGVLAEIGVEDALTFDHPQHSASTSSRQVRFGGRKLVASLLRSCTDVQILATSREQLGVDGESVLPLSPLAVPDANAEPTLRGLPDYDAVALFADRAAAAAPGFHVTEGNKAIVAQICSRLDGLPLAIELAAARLRAMSPEQILDRLADPSTLLTRGSRTAPARQQTLSWSIDWSYDLCTPAEQRMWARLSVFAGSFELQAAEAICGADTPDVDVDDLLSSLVDKSILIRTESNGGVRFRILETLSDYGRESFVRPVNTPKFVSATWIGTDGW
jgi:hypothetical protein